MLDINLNLRSTAVAATALDLTEKGVRDLIKTGKLPGYKIGNSFKIAERDIANFLEAAKVKPTSLAQRAFDTLVKAGAHPEFFGNPADGRDDLDGDDVDNMFCEAVRDALVGSAGFGTLSDGTEYFDEGAPRQKRSGRRYEFRDESALVVLGEGPTIWFVEQGGYYSDGRINYANADDIRDRITADRE